MPEVTENCRVEVFKASGKWYTGEQLPANHPMVIAIRERYFDAADIVHAFCARREFPVMSSGTVPDGWFVLIDDSTKYPVLIRM